jgi:menaquinone-dependent protoporphyrinogen IX oxidase
LNSIAVVYKSTYGSTKQYAEWIAEELNASLFEATSIKPSQMLEFDTVIYGGGLYASGINGVKLVTKNPCKSLVVFTVGAADPNTTDYSEILSKNFTHEFLSKIKVFHLQGGIDYSKLGVIHKTMMAMLKKMRVDSKPQEQRSDEDAEFLETYGKKFDYTDKAAIKPLVDFVRAQE